MESELRRELEPASPKAASEQVRSPLTVIPGLDPGSSGRPEMAGSSPAMTEVWGSNSNWLDAAPKDMAGTRPAMIGEEGEGS